jgi:hypothetical protein
MSMVQILEPMAGLFGVSTATMLGTSIPWSISRNRNMSPCNIFRLGNSLCRRKWPNRQPRPNLRP